MIKQTKLFITQSSLNPSNFLPKNIYLLLTYLNSTTVIFISWGLTYHLFFSSFDFLFQICAPWWFSLYHIQFPNSTLWMSLIAVFALFLYFIFFRFTTIEIVWFILSDKADVKMHIQKIKMHCSPPRAFFFKAITLPCFVTKVRQLNKYKSEENENSWTL